MLLSTSDDAEPPANWERIDTELDAEVEAAVGFAGFGADFPKKLMRLFCFMFSDEERFSCCTGMVDSNFGRDVRRDICRVGVARYDMFVHII